MFNYVDVAATPGEFNKNLMEMSNEELERLAAELNSGKCSVGGRGSKVSFRFFFSNEKARKHKNNRTR